MTDDTGAVAPTGQGSRRERLLLGLGAAALTLPTVRTSGFCLDDAFIHLAYVSSIHAGDGISYNPGDWETGISSPLWLALLALWPTGAPTIFGIKAFGALLHVAGVMLIAALARACDPEAPPRFSLAAGLLWAATPLAVQGATSGMEVPLASALALGVTVAALRARWKLAFVLALLGYLARPELLVYAAALSAGLLWLRRDPRALLLLAGAGAGTLVFWAYCYSVSGHLWPNTYYVKGGGLHLGSLAYLVRSVLAPQPVVLSVAGVVIAGLGAYAAWRGKRHALLVLVGTALVTLLAIALSRTLHPGVRFFQSRYFVVTLWALPLLCAYGFARMPRAPAWALMAPVAALSLYLTYQQIQLQHAQERGVHRLHVEPAAYIARRVPDARVVGVEGAGALRYLLPRSIEVVDLMGLNDRAIAHMGGQFFRKLCHLKARGVTHLAYPAQWRDNVHKAFELETLERFTEHAYAQVDPPVPWQLTVARVVRPKDDFAAYCAKRGLQ
ncbi:MAG: hypothetical protein OXT09_01705 [Myxococcales bacterium]|nr:hypothetical protein [Myxococcales bacterium]